MQSMTGYGRCQLTMEGREMTLEIKTVNHRFLDISFRMPRNVSFLEETLRKAIASSMRRGHADVFINYRNTRADARTVQVDTALVAAYEAAAEQIRQATGTQEPLTLAQVMTLPDVVQVTEAEEDREQVTALAEAVLTKVLDEVHAMRIREGAALRRDLEEHLDALARLREEIALRGQGCHRRGAVPAAKPHCTNARLPSGGGRGGPSAGFPDPGDEPGGQHHRLQGFRRDDHQLRGRRQVGDRKAARASAERGVRRT